MTQKLKTYAWDITEHLRTEEEMAAYLSAILDEGDPALFVSAVGDIAKARGLAEIAQKAGVSRTRLSRSFSETGQPEFSTVINVIRSLGMRLTAEPQAVGITNT